jgi:3-hydroxybutyryl-CoA dehydrogenase
MALSRVAVVGPGFMGSGIAESAASAGLDVTVFEPEEAPLGRSRSRLHESVDRAVARGKMTGEEAEGLVGRIAHTTEMADLDGVDAVIGSGYRGPTGQGQAVRLT